MLFYLVLFFRICLFNFAQRNFIMIHLLESTKDRIKRTGMYCSGSAPRCGNGSYHAVTTTNHKDVTCPKCLQLLKKGDK